LIEVVEQEGHLTVDLLERPLEIIVLSYEDYLRYSTMIGENVRRTRPDWKLSLNFRYTTANFLPLPQYDRNVILTYTWEWNTILHELCHVAIMRQWSSDAAVNHPTVYAVHEVIMKSDAYMAFLAYATQR
jgi:hypothetical protein